MVLFELVNRLQLFPRWVILAVSTLSAIALALADATHETDFEYKPLFVLPVLMVACRFTPLLTILFALLTMIVSLSIKTYGFSQGQQSADNLQRELSWFAMLVLVGGLAAGLRVIVGRERDLARCDSLTGLANARAFRERLASEVNRSSRTERPVTLAFVDCDRFKQINDTLGHEAGNDVLKLIAGIMQSQTRNYDLAARIGGDEFTLLLPETDARGARIVIERIREAIQHAAETAGRHFSVSIGVCTSTKHSLSPDELLQIADQKMYEAKRTGPGMVVYHVDTDPNSENRV